jgi:hypothetical protein
MIWAVNQVFIDRTLKYKKKSKDSKSVRTEEWLFDSGASVHVTPNKHLLLNSKPCSIQIRVTNGCYVSASLVGNVLLKCKCDSLLLLCGILYYATFNKNIISVPQLLRSKEYKITMSKNYVEIKYQGKELNIMFKSTANLYALDAERQWAYALENPYLLTTENNSRVMHKNLYNTCFLSKNSPSALSTLHVKKLPVHYEHKVYTTNYNREEYKKNSTKKGHGNTNIKKRYIRVV